MLLFLKTLKRFSKNIKEWKIITVKLPAIVLGQGIADYLLYPAVRLVTIGGTYKREV